jgi:hypothetical protein
MRFSLKSILAFVDPRSTEKKRQIGTFLFPAGEPGMICTPAESGCGMPTDVAVPVGVLLGVPGDASPAPRGPWTG